jgi:hypothetical protein
MNTCLIRSARKVLWFWGDHPLWKGRYEVLGAVGQHTVKAEHIRAIAAS